MLQHPVDRSGWSVGLDTSYLGCQALNLVYWLRFCEMSDGPLNQGTLYYRLIVRAMTNAESHSKRTH